MVNQDSLLERSIFLKKLNEPCNFVFIENFRKTFSSGDIQDTEDVLMLSFPSFIIKTEEVSPNKRDNVKSLFGPQGV